MTSPSAEQPVGAQSGGVAVVGAQARELARVRVSFAGSVKQDDPSAPDDALNPARYRLARLSAPAVDAAIVAVAPVTRSAVDLVVDRPLTPGASYRVDVTGVVDALAAAAAAAAAGEAAGEAAIFTGFVPPRPATRVFDLYRLLPEINRREDTTGDLRGFLSCLQEVTDLLLHDVDRFSDILDPDVAPEPFVDLMLPELGNPFAFDLSLVDKRRLVNVLLPIYREKGTAAGIRNAIRFFLALEVSVTTYTGEALILGESSLGDDWILGPSNAFAAYAFEIVVARMLTPTERGRLRQIVDYMKPAQTHFVRLVEPTIPEVVDHVELGQSELGNNWLLH